MSENPSRFDTLRLTLYKADQIRNQVRLSLRTEDAGWMMMMEEKEKEKEKEGEEEEEKEEKKKKKKKGMGQHQAAPYCFLVGPFRAKVHHPNNHHHHHLSQSLSPSK